MIVYDFDKRLGQYRNIELRDKLFESRCVFLTGHIDQIMIEDLIIQLIVLDNKSNEPIRLYISSGGGEVLSGLSLLSTMERIRSKVNCICLSSAMSMASVILSAGHRRYITKYGYVMVHSVKSGYYGHEKDLEISLEHTKELNTRLIRILSKNCGYSIDEMEKLTEHDLYLNAQQAIEFGICDEIL